MGPFGGWIPHISFHIRVLMGGRKCPVYKERDGGSYWSPYGGLERTRGWQLGPGHRYWLCPGLLCVFASHPLVEL